VLLEQELHDRRLARAAGPDEEDELAAADREARVLQTEVAGVVLLDDVAELDDRGSELGSRTGCSRLRAFGCQGHERRGS
jgi:hypothetical protein